MPRLISCKATSCEAPVDSAYRAGITRAITATTNIVTWIPDASREKVCDLWRNPPASMLTPRTRRTFPMIEPVREALTTSVRPLDRAKIAMISSVALPKVALRRPPTPGPACLPSSSVASPRNQASGTIAIPAAANTIAAGPNITSRIQLRGTKRPRRTAQVYGRRGPRSIAGGNKPPFLTSAQTLQARQPDAPRLMSARGGRVVDRHAQSGGVPAFDLMGGAHLERRNHPPRIRPSLVKRWPRG